MNYNTLLHFTFFLISCVALLLCILAMQKKCNENFGEKLCGTHGTAKLGHSCSTSYADCAIVKETDLSYICADGLKCQPFSGAPSHGTCIPTPPSPTPVKPTPTPIKPTPTPVKPIICSQKWQPLCNLLSEISKINTK